MIYIWNNGGLYSDKRIVFVEVPSEVLAEDVRWALTNHPEHEDAYIMGEADSITWWVGGSATFMDALGTWAGDVMGGVDYEEYRKGLHPYFCKEILRIWENAIDGLRTPEFKQGNLKALDRLRALFQKEGKI